MSDRQICGECKWHILETRQYPNKRGQITSTFQVRSGWVCSNSDSDYFADYTEYTDTCPMFQERGIEK